MSCQYIKRTGNKCENAPIGKSEFCHLKTHHSDKKGYEKILREHVTAFENETLCPYDFNFYDVIPDGACLFRSIAQGIVPYIDKVKNNAKLLKLKETKNPHTYNLRYKTDRESWMLDFAAETEVARYLQQVAVNYLIEHAEDEMIEGTGYTIGECVLETHELKSMEEYKSLYSIFAGDPDYIIEKTGKVYKSGPLVGQPVHKRVRIPDRWGSYPEQYALAKVFGLNINVYVSRRFSTAQFKILKEANLDKGRLKHYGCTKGGEVLVNLLLFERPVNSHYIVFYPVTKK